MRTTLRVLATIAVILVVLCVRVELTARADLARAAQLAASDDTAGAIVHFRRSAALYVPGSPTPAAAHAGLFAIAADAERAGQGDTALAAYRAVRASALASRSLFVPHGDELDRANDRIAELQAEQPTGNIDGAIPRSRLRDRARQQLEDQRGARPLLALLAVFSFVGFLGAIVAFLQFAFDDEDRWVAAAARRWGSCAVIAFGLFVVGLSLA